MCNSFHAGNVVDISRLGNRAWRGGELWYACNALVKKMLLLMAKQSEGNEIEQLLGMT